MGYLGKKLGLFLQLIKVEQTLFAFPFAYVGAFLAAGTLSSSIAVSQSSGAAAHNLSPGLGSLPLLTAFGATLPSLQQLLWITLAMVGARTAGMSLNRLIDREIDARNPRTRERALPRGLLSPLSVGIVAFLSLFLLGLSAYRLNPLCLALSPLAALLLFLYSYTKRYTWLTHFFLGLTWAAAPIGGWVAVTGTLSLPPFILGFACIFWLAGFDIIYATQDYHFDREEGIFSIPQTFGIQRALILARYFHLVTFLSLTALGIFLHLGVIYFTGLFLVLCLLTYEHLTVSPSDLSRVNQAFFVTNASISIIYTSFTLGDLILP